MKRHVEQISKIAGVLFINILSSFNVSAQKTVALERKSKYCTDCYNIDQASVKIVLSNDTFLLPKMESYKFILTDSFLIRAKTEKVEKAKVFVETSKYVFISCIDKDVFIENSDFSLAFFRIKNVVNVNVTYDNLDGTRRISRPFKVKLTKKR